MKDYKWEVVFLLMVIAVLASSGIVRSRNEEALKNENVRLKQEVELLKSCVYAEQTMRELTEIRKAGK